MRAGRFNGCVPSAAERVAGLASTVAVAAPPAHSAAAPYAVPAALCPLCRWSWAICTDTCAICRNNLYEPSIEYQANPTGGCGQGGVGWG